MPISQGAGGSGIPGVMLKAWAYCDAAGVLLASMNVASVVKGASGVYTVNFTAAMNGVNYIARFNTGKIAVAGQVGGVLFGATVGSATLNIFADNVVAVNLINAPFIVEFYE